MEEKRMETIKGLKSKLGNDNLSVTCTFDCQNNLTECGIYFKLQMGRNRGLYSSFYVVFPLANMLMFPLMNWGYKWLYKHRFGVLRLP